MATDMNARGALIEYNLVEDNWAEGIFYEISQDAVIRNNRVYRNRRPRRNWYWDGGITWPPALMSRSTATGCPATTMGSPGPSRTGSTPPRRPTYSTTKHVHNNLICATGTGGHPTGVVADNGANLAVRDISFTDNTIQSSSCESLSP